MVRALIVQLTLDVEFKAGGAVAGQLDFCRKKYSRKRRKIYEPERNLFLTLGSNELLFIQ
jgi:hypothetical protein